jgi:hypothetical protein
MHIPAGMAKFAKALLVALGCMVILVAGAYIFRIGLLRAGINAVLAGDTAVTRIQGVQLSFTHAAVAEIEVRLDSGQLLLISSVDVDFVTQGLFSAPVVRNLTVASARLTDDSQADISASNPIDDSESPASDVGAVKQTALLLSELLQQLRDFPLARMDINELELPQFRQKLALHLEQQPDNLDIQIVTGALQLLVNFSQDTADATAQFGLSLQADGLTLADATISLLPESSGYQLAGGGKIAIPDANTAFAEYLTTPLPVSDIAVQWDIAAMVSDDLANDPADVINLSVAPESAFTLNAGVVADLGELAVVIPTKAELAISPGSGMNITGHLPLRLTGDWQQQPLQAELTLTPADCRIVDLQDCRAGFESKASLAAFAIASADQTTTTTFETIEFAGNGDVQITSDLIELALAPGARLASASVTAPAVDITAVSVANDAALVVDISLADAPLTITGDQVSLTLNELKSGAYSASGVIALRAIKLRSAEQITGNLNLQTAGLVVSGPRWLPTVGIDAALEIEGDLLSFSTPLQLQNPSADARLRAAGSYDLATGAGQFNVQMPALTLTGEGNSLSSYFNGWPYEADVMTGTLALDLDVDLQPAAVDAQQSAAMIKANTTIALTDVGGFYAENFFRGLNATIDASYDSSSSVLPITTPPSTLTLDELNIGLPITDVALAYQLDADSGIVNVNSISANALDGTVSGMGIRYDLGRELNEFILNFSGLRLERMMELAEYEGIEASGAVSGELPIAVKEGKIEIEAGKLYADAPGGSIRYLNAPPAGQGNPAMDLVNQALSNYQFQSLESAIDYTPDGELQLAMQLRGRNPDMNGGQAINLNLNISDNIPTLLKSLQAGRVIEDFLQDQYK